MSELLDEINAAKQPKHISVPKGWEPYTEYTEMIGSAIVTLPAPNSSERDLLISAGFNPDEWKIEGPIQTRKWQRYDQEWQYYYKMNVVAGESDEVVEENIEDLVEHIRSHHKPKQNIPTGNDAFVFFMSDLQIGKAEGEIGTEQTVERYMDCVDQAVLQVKALRASGKSVTHGCIAGLGDIVENCTGFYENQLFIVDKNQRDQNRISRELIYYTIDKFLPIFEELTVACVGGNHGESGRSSSNKQQTDNADNHDVAVFESVREAYDRSGNNDINWVVPNDELSVALSLGGVNLGITHGHLFRKGSTPAQKALSWFSGQVFGGGPTKDCNILVHGHYHHLLVTQVGKRTIVQTPAIDPGSEWVTNSSGERTPPGVQVGS